MCDHCVVLLLDDLEQAGALLPAIREQLRGVNASSVVWARLHRLNASIADLQVLPGPAPSLPCPGRRLSPSPPRRASSGNLLAPVMRLHSSWRHWNDRPQASGRTCSSWTARQAPGEPCPRTHPLECSSSRKALPRDRFLSADSSPRGLSPRAPNHPASPLTRSSASRPDGYFIHRPQGPEPRPASFWTAPRPRWAGHRRCWQPSGLWTAP